METFILYFSIAYLAFYAIGIFMDYWDDFSG